MKRILLDSVPSTNDYALGLLEHEQPEEGTVIQARDQTRGRGQAGNPWHAEPGRNLTVSVILYPTFLDARRPFVLSQAVALAVTDCVTELAELPASIKWPNDVLLAGRKVAGLLIENRVVASRIRASVVGIGINVNQRSFPPDLAFAGSLLGATGVDHDLEDVLAFLHARLLARYGELRSRPGDIATDYRGRLYGLGRELSFTAPGGSFRGTIQGVDDEGRLVVREADGAVRAFRTKEIAFETPLT